MIISIAQYLLPVPCVLFAGWWGWSHWLSAGGLLRNIGPQEVRISGSRLNQQSELLRVWEKQWNSGQILPSKRQELRLVERLAEKLKETRAEVDRLQRLDNEEREREREARKQQLAKSREAPISPIPSRPSRHESAGESDGHFLDGYFLWPYEASARPAVDSGLSRNEGQYRRIDHTRLDPAMVDLLKKADEVAAQARGELPYGRPDVAGPEGE